MFSKHFLPLSCEVDEIICGRFLKINVKFEKTTTVLMNLYTPNKGLESNFLKKGGCCFARFKSRGVVIYRWRF